MATGFWELVNDYKVAIPIIQRDYAQGRESGKVPVIRENILNAIFSAIKDPGNPLELDFVYGCTKTVEDSESGVTEIFYPLDGQQRLTTLFLLHWYIAAKEGMLLTEGKALRNFTYEIRHSSRLFCEALVQYEPDDFGESIKNHIFNQPWFFSAWKNDPTIHSMLVMLESIQDNIKKFQLENVWEVLTSDNPPILFHLLPTDKLGMPDDLYIKMNSRGKELTEFEYFKIRFSEMLKNEHGNEFNHKIDQEWSDLFWDLYKEESDGDIAQKVDNGFLRFFNYLTDMIIADKEIEFSDTQNVFERIKRVYSDDENVEHLFRVLDLMVNSRKANPGFYETNFYVMNDDFDLNKVRIFFGRPNIDLFKKCAEAYDPDQRNNPFSIGEQLLLYACIVHLETNSSDFPLRVRTIRNLIANSEDTVRKEYLPSLLKEVKILIINGEIVTESKFNTTQIKEENQKKDLLSEYENLRYVLYRLEDHNLLQGCISILGLRSDLDTIGQKFLEVFIPGCNYVAISCALFTYGDYTQTIRWKNLLASVKESTWRELFTPSNRRGGFEKTKSVMEMFLSDLDKYPSKTVESIIADFLDLYTNDPSKSKDWRYYFIKYREFRFHADGYYYWKDKSKHYESIMMSRTQMNGKHWDPVLLTIKKYKQNCLNIGNYGDPLIYVRGDISIEITNHNDHFKLSANESNPESLDFLKMLQLKDLIDDNHKAIIEQDGQGLDIDDRVLEGIALVESMERI